MGAVLASQGGRWIGLPGAVTEMGEGEQWTIPELVPPPHWPTSKPCPRGGVSTGGPMGSGGSKHKQSRPNQPSERPSPPGKPQLVASEYQATDQDVITIKWEPPLYSGGSKIIGYLVEHRRSGTPHWVRSSPLLAHRPLLSLSGLEPGQRYQFRVFAESSSGLRSEPSPLSQPVAVTPQRGVAVAPVFTRPLTDTTATENEKVEFTVRVDGTPFPKVSWYKDGFEIFSNRRQRILTDEDGTSTLVIHQAALSDEGEVKCSATNKAGHAVTKALVTLQAPPAIRLPRQYEDGLLFELGDTLRLKVSVSGRPQPDLTWYHNGRVLNSGSRVESSTTDKYALLRVSNATREDRGEYQVRANNCLGEDLASILVTITDRPLPPGKVNVVMTLGRSVTLAWTIPYDDGGCKIGNYIVEYFRIGWNMWLKAATCRQLSTTIGDLIEGSQYKFRVKAENPYGISEPSQESDVIFIPDPKRGLLEPPENQPERLLGDITPERWGQEEGKAAGGGGGRRHGEPVAGTDQQRPGEDWLLEEDGPVVSSPLALAHQVLRKVKMAPTRTWSEESQGSPPREASPLPLPVPPKRKHKPLHSHQDKTNYLSEDSEMVTFKESKAERPWNKELSPLSTYDELHSSSEMMLVLLPDKENDKASHGKGEGISLALEDFDQDIAPPMSLSAPELSSCEPFDFRELRLASSSSEIMHELALIRLNKEVTEEEAENHLRRRYGLERKRSFERRTSLKRNSFSSSKENLPTPEQLLTRRKELLADIDAKKKKRLSDPIEELEERDSRVEQFSERFLSLEKEFKEYNLKTNMKIFEDDDSDKVSNYSEEEFMDHDTYHPRSMVPRVQEPIALMLNKPPMVTINEEPEPLKFDSPETLRKESQRSSLSPEPGKRFWRGSPTPDREVASQRRSMTPSPSPRYSRSPSPDFVVEATAVNQEKHQPSSSPSTPKPILKVRDKSLERLDTSELSLNKKVRIDVPGGGDPTEYEDKTTENALLIGEENTLFAGEVARNRRKKQISSPDSATKVIVDHYSDLVREYGQNKKPTTKLYLSYEELKAAAEKCTPNQDEFANITEMHLTDSSQDININNSPNTNDQDKNVSLPKNIATLHPKSKFYLEYTLDLFLFLVACWLYIFKDYRLTIPILILMAYRQLSDSIKKIKFPWRNKKKN